MFLEVVRYENFRGNIFYLNENTTKKGNPKYSFSRDIAKANIDTIPKGYRIYENLDGQVFLVKEENELITNQELLIVKKAVKELSNILYFRVSASKNVITVGTGRVFDESKEIDKSCFDKKEAKTTHYLPVLRFVLVDKEERLFEVERYCFRGTVDDWIFIDGGHDLQELSKKYCSHLGRLSFYELV